MGRVDLGRAVLIPNYLHTNMVVRLSLEDHHYFLNKFVCVGEFFDG